MCTYAIQVDFFSVGRSILAYKQYDEKIQSKTYIECEQIQGQLTQSMYEKHLEQNFEVESKNNI